MNLNKKAFIEGYNIVIVPREIKGKVVYFGSNEVGSQILDKCSFVDINIPDDIIFQAHIKYPIKKGWHGSNNDYGDVDWIDFNSTERNAYIDGMLYERNRGK